MWKKGDKKKAKIAKSHVVDGMTTICCNMEKVKQWMCFVAWEQGGPENKKGTVTQCKRKGCTDDSNKPRGKSFLGIVPGKVMNEKIKKIPYDKGVGGT